MDQIVHEVEYEMTSDLAEDYARLVVRHEYGGWKKIVVQTLVLLLLGGIVLGLGWQGLMPALLASGLLFLLAVPLGQTLVRRR